MVQVKFDPGVPEEFDRLLKVVRARMIGVFERLRKWPNVAGVRALRGPLTGRFRIRTGDYRVQFRLEAGEIRIEKVGHRDGFYEDLSMYVQTIQLEGKRFVVIEEDYFRRLRRRAGESDDLELPPFPEPDTEGRFLAIEYARASIARDIIRERKSLGLSQERLAMMAGIRQETLSRIETGKHTPTARVVNKIDQALSKFRRTHARKEGKRNPGKPPTKRHDRKV